MQTKSDIKYGFKYKQLFKRKSYWNVIIINKMPLNITLEDFRTGNGLQDF